MDQTAIKEKELEPSTSTQETDEKDEGKLSYEDRLRLGLEVYKLSTENMPIGNGRPPIVYSYTKEWYMNMYGSSELNWLDGDHLGLPEIHRLEESPPKVSPKLLCTRQRCSTT